MHAASLSRIVPITGVFALLVACGLVGAYLLWPDVAISSRPTQSARQSCEVHGLDSSVAVSVASASGTLDSMRGATNPY